MPEIVDQSSEIVPISGAVGALISLYNQVEALFDDTRLKDQIAWELRTDLRFLPSVIAEVLPALNTGNSHFDRNFFRVVQLMCKALEEARAALDEYVLSTIHIWQIRSLGRRLSNARNRIRHAVTLYNTYCNTRQLCTLNNAKGLSEPLGKLRETLQELEAGSAQPCPKKILKLVARLRTRKCSPEAVQKAIMGGDELDHFVRAGGLEALVQLLPISPSSYGVQKQALSYLQELAMASSELKQKLCCTTGALEQLATLVTTSGGAQEIQQAALGALRVVLQNNEVADGRRVALVPRIFPCLTRLLASPAPTLQANAVAVLWELSAYPEHRPHIITASPIAVPRLVRLFSSPSATMQFCAGGTLYNLCATQQRIRHTIAALEGVPERLLVLLNRMETMPPAARQHLRHGSERKVEDRPTAGVVGWAVAMLDTADEAEQGKGLEVVQRVPEALMGVVVAEGAIGRLVRLLDGEHAEGAARVLHRLSIPDENEVAIVAQIGAVTRLVALLTIEHSVPIRQAATKVLESLSFNANNRRRIADYPQAIERLATILFFDSVDAQASAASALWNLANTNAANKARVSTCAGVLPRLVELLDSSSTLVQEKAAGTLMNLAYNNSNRKKVACLPHAFPRLVLLLESNNTLVHQNAAGALYNLSLSLDNSIKIASIPSSIPALVSLLTSMSVLVQEYSAGALANLAFDDDTRHHIKEQGAVVFLEGLTQSPSNVVKACAKRALENLFPMGASL